MSDAEKAIRAAKLTLGGLLEKRREKVAVERAQGQIAPSKYLPNVPRAVHAAGGYVPQAALPVGRLAIARPLQTAPQQGFADTLGGLASAAGNISDLVTGKEPETAQPEQKPAAPELSFGPGVSEGAQNAFNALAASWGQPLQVVSAYRDPKKNEAVGGAKGSQHLHGNAFDINTADLSYEDRLKLADAAWNAGFRGFGFYDNNMHFDVGDQRAWGPNFHGDSIPDWARGWWDARAGYADGGSVVERSPMFEGMSEHLRDDEGKPMELWHGTPGQPFEAFDNSKIGVRDPGFFGRGHYLTPDRGVAEAYADPDEMGRGSVMGPLHAALKNPYVWDVSDENKAHKTLRDLQTMGVMQGKDRMDPWDNLQRHHIDQFMQHMQQRGHDGVIHKTGFGPQEIVVFNPNMIKHRDAEVGDPNDPRIMRASGGRLYSKAAQIIRGLKQEKGTAEDMIRAAIGRGAKKNEIGYANPPGGKISRDELAQHFESAVPKIDVRKLEEGNFRYDSPERYERQINYLYGQNRYPEAEALEREFERFEGFGGKDAAKYARFQLPGGQNYREHVLTLPENTGDKFYATSHWGKIENPIGHIRMSDRTVMPPHDQMMEIMGRVMDHGQGIDGAVEHGVVTPQEGATLARHFGLDSSAYFDKPGLDKKILHVEEAQSDWASGARKNGFRTGTEKQDYDAYVENMRRQMINRIDASPMVREALIEKYKKMDPYMLAMKLGTQNEHLEMARKASDHNPAVPKAPYTDPSGDEWNQLVMKHVLHEAAHGGYDGITFTPDAAQSARWGGTDFSGIYDKKLPAAAHKLVQMHDQSVKADQINLPGTTSPSAVIPLTPEARESIKQNGFPAFRRGGYVTTIRRSK